MRFTTKPATTAPGLIRLGSAFTNVAPGGIQDGPFVALDVETGKIAWQYKAPQPLIGGVLATAGNLVFMGEGNGWFDAFNATSGDRVWRYNLGAGVNAPPITYQVNGEQYIAVAAGGNFQTDVSLRRCACHLQAVFCGALNKVGRKDVAGNSGVHFSGCGVRHAKF